jgi:ATP diphosphatase
MATFELEEGFELVEAIENDDDAGTVEELGDVLMVLVLIARIATEEGRFDIEGAAQAVTQKLIRRHPHVFGEARAEDSDEALKNWEAIKKEERREREEDASALAGLPLALPALLRAARTSSKARSAGFRWKSPAGALEKLSEELAELHEALEGADLEGAGPGESRIQLDPGTLARASEELGDLLLSAAILGDYLRIDPEAACRGALRRFEARFRHMETSLGGDLHGPSLEELLAAWQEAKSGLC